MWQQFWSFTWNFSLQISVFKWVKKINITFWNQGTKVFFECTNKTSLNFGPIAVHFREGKVFSYLILSWGYPFKVNEKEMY